MNKTTITVALLALSLPLLGACGNQSSTPATTTHASDGTAVSANTEPQTMIGKAVEKGMREARQELETSNLNLNGGVHVKVNGKGVWSDDGDDNLPKAAITPQGDLLIDDKAVAIDDGQRAMLLDYRKRVINVAGAGMSIGTQGAELAGKAMSEALANVFKSGDKKDFESRMEGEGRKIEAQAKLLCNQLPDMLDSQNKLAASLPAFKPYAKMDQGDIDDCMDDHDDNNAADKAETQARIRDEIRKSIRKAARPVATAAGNDNN